MSTFVSVGNATQPFHRLLSALEAVTLELPRPIVVQRGVSQAFNPAWETHDFLPMARFEELVASASVLIMHAGAGSIVHAVRAGKRPIVMPRRALLGEHVDGHQLEFAEAMAKAGKVLVAETVDALREAVRLSQGAAAPATSKKLPDAIAALLKEYASRA